MRRGLNWGAEGFFGADNTEYTYTDDATHHILWTAVESARQSFGATITRLSWDYGDTYQDHFRPYRILGPMSHYMSCEKILLFDGTCSQTTGEASIGRTTLETRALESMKWLSRRCGYRKLSVQTGGELPETAAAALKAMDQAEVVRRVVAPYAKTVYNPPVLCMSGNGFANVISAVYATKRYGVPTFDLYIDRRSTSDFTATLASMITQIEAAFTAVGISARSLACMEYGMNSTYANGGNQATYALAMRSSLEARSYKMAMFYSATDSQGFALVNPSTAALTSFGTAVLAG